MMFFLLMMACTPETTGFIEVSHEAGRAFVWDRVQVVIIPETNGEWLWGIYLEGDQLTASWSQREWMGVPGWIPLLLVTPDIDSVVLANDELIVWGEGSAEHGCDPETRMQISMSSDDGVVIASVQIFGVPYLALPPEGDGDIDGTPIDLGSLEQEIFHNVSRAQFNTSFSDAVTVLYENPLPWLELATHDEVVEIDIDHSCEESAQTTFYSRLQVSL